MSFVVASGRGPLRAGPCGALTGNRREAPKGLEWVKKAGQAAGATVGANDLGQLMVDREQQPVGGPSNL